MTQSPMRPGAHLIQTLPKLSQDTVVFSGGHFVPGEVVTMVGETHTKLDAGSETTDVALGVCANYYDASTEDVPGVATKRLAVVDGQYLVWPEGATDQQINDWKDELAANYLLVR